MNWGLFWPLLAVSIIIKLLSENPSGRSEIVLIVLSWLAVSLIAALIVPPEFTTIGFWTCAAPVVGDVPLKIYRHFAMGKIYGTAAD